MIDTHCHIFDKAYNADRTETIARAQASGVTQLLMPNVDRSTYSNMMSVAKQFPAVCKPMIGVHPTSISAASVEDDLRFVQHELEAQPAGTFVAMGEVGIDCYHSKEFLAEQIFAFEKLLRLAEKFQLPVVIHARDSFNEIMEVLRRVHPKVSGVFHAFSSSIEMYHEVKKMGDYKFGIGGVVTFKNAKLAEVVQHIPLSDILLETDAPYLTPTPHRGTRNESSYLTFVAQKIAELKGVSAAEVDEITTENATKLFRL
ncbi:MAG: TatD family hydrolase [Prevotellaceae bacterium]|jgi:TatD DNase family protein|nr:TatD family hydrolase [Prevotellaceae bacterium]